MRIGTKDSPLQNSALLVLYGTSYTPFSVLIALRLFVSNANYLNYAEISTESLKWLVSKSVLARSIYNGTSNLKVNL